MLAEDACRALWSGVSTFCLLGLGAGRFGPPTEHEYQLTYLRNVLKLHSQTSSRLAGSHFLAVSLPNQLEMYVTAAAPAVETTEEPGAVGKTLSGIKYFACIAIGS